MTNQPIKISENCWKHIYEHVVFYTNASNIKSEYHRENGPAIEDIDGYKAWYINGQLHRKGGPAIERSNGDKEWWVNGKRHREDGPAIECSNGAEYWYYNDEYIDVIYQEDFELYIKNIIFI